VALLVPRRGAEIIDPTIAQAQLMTEISGFRAP
jgi:hypothetical protein